MVDERLAKSIFVTAIEMLRAQRADFLSQATANDAALRERVEELLTAHDDPRGFLEPSAACFGRGVDFRPAELPLVEQPGTVIGSYKLLEQIGEGGMGIVFMAEQQAPVRRRVALKIIKPGMDTRQVIARFEAERQALALMDHSNIARVLDAAATDSNRPYFVMELVRGVPITDYCDQNDLAVRERLQLFVQVCHAVQHAHQKGIIHRDLKPSNVLVTLDDGRAVPKVIDFGVAKAINQQLTEKTLFTNFSQMIGTPLYMSPEQAEWSSQDVDTRSDIYSMGVLLYELLTGTTPFEGQRLREAAFDEIRRIIREEEPPRPSTRISTLGTSRTGTARRAVDSARLNHVVRGDLDWIVMKALEKDRSRRYATANAMARDIQRYLSDQPVEACPPSLRYRFGKFARRNRAALIAALLLGTSLLLGTVASTWQAIRATRAENRAEVAQAAESKERAEAEAQREQAQANFLKARDTVEKYFTLVSESKLLDVPGLQPLRTELLEAALDFYRKLADQRSAEPAVLADLAVTYLRVAVVYAATDRNDDAVAALQSGLAIADRLHREHPSAAEHHRKLAGFWKGRRNVQSNTKLPRDPLVAYQALVRLNDLWEQFAAENPTTLGFQSDLAANYYILAELLISSDHRQDGLEFLQKARDGWERLARENPTVPEFRAELARACEDLAWRLSDPAQSEQARETLEGALRLRERLVADFPEVPQHQLDLAESLKSWGDHAVRAGRQQDAQAAYVRAIGLAQNLADKYPRVPVYSETLVLSQHELTKLLISTGQLPAQQAEQDHRRQIATAEKLLRDFPNSGVFPLHLATCYRDLAAFLAAQGRFDDAIAAHLEGTRFLETLAKQRPGHGYFHSLLARTHLDFGEVLCNGGRANDGVEFCQTALGLFEKLAGSVSQDAPYLRDLVDCRRRVAAIRDSASTRGADSAPASAP